MDILLQSNYSCFPLNKMYTGFNAALAVSIDRLQSDAVHMGEQRI